jgi:hypothetical protein
MPKSSKMSKGDIVMMLLGSSEEVDFRRKIKKQLTENGFKKKNVIIMEDVEKNRKDTDYGSLDEKFEWIVRDFKPRFFFAIFHKKVQNID